MPEAWVHCDKSEGLIPGMVNWFNEFYCFECREWHDLDRHTAPNVGLITITSGKPERT
jgi:hypothetical protein